MKINNLDQLELDSGVIVHGLIGGLSLTKYNNLAAGYDSSLYQNTYSKDGDIYIPLTMEERKEIAEYMILRWRKWGGIENGCLQTRAKGAIKEL